MGLLSNLKDIFEVVGEWTVEHSPAILTTAGVVGLGATAYLTYKSSDKIEEVVEYVEDKRERNEPLDKMHVTVQLAKALALPIAIGATSVACIVGSYSILTGRLTVLGTAFTALSNEYSSYRRKHREVYGEEESRKFFAVNETRTTDEEGNEVIETEPVNPGRGLTSAWFSESEKYVSDDIQYDIALVEQCIKNVEVESYNNRGTRFTLNEMYRMFGLDETRQGSLLGWNSNGLNVSYEVFMNISEPGENGNPHPDILITWTVPEYLYGGLSQGVPIPDTTSLEG